MNEPSSRGGPRVQGSRPSGNLSGPVCWQVVNVNPYHSARMGAFARRAQVPPVFLELTDEDAFQPLRHGRSGSEAHRRQTLFPGRQFRQLRREQIGSALRECISELNPAAVCINGWGVRGSIEALRECLSMGIPAVLMSESTVGDIARSAYKERIKHRVVSLFSAALVGGSPQVEYASALGVPRHRIFVGYDVVDNYHFIQGASAARNNAPKIRHDLGLPEHYLLACCRFEGKKNLFGLLEAYAAYADRAGREAWKLAVIGGGALSEQLLVARSRLGLREDVLFVGLKAYHELPIYYGLARAFVHASTSEPWGLVVNEAMAAGLPVLVSQRCGCARDLVEEGRNGFTFDPDNVEELSKLMLRLSSMPEGEREAMGRASQEIISRWTPEVFADSLERAIQAALAAPQPSLSVLDRALLSLLTRMG
jgi:1,2-diacylglycerol 3-alpha-glucosyltransferase